MVLFPRFFLLLSYFLKVEQKGSLLMSAVHSPTAVFLDADSFDRRFRARADGSSLLLIVLSRLRRVDKRQRESFFCACSFCLFVCLFVALGKEKRKTEERTSLSFFPPSCALICKKKRKKEIKKHAEDKKKSLEEK